MLSIKATILPQHRQRRRQLWLAVAWAVGIALALVGLLDGVDPAQPYGSNYPGDIGVAVAVVSAVVAILYALLVPSPHVAAVLRAIAAVLVSLAAVVLMFVASTHAGTVLIGTFLWTLPLALAIALYALDTVVTAVAERFGSRRR